MTGRAASTIAAGAGVLAACGLAVAFVLALPSMAEKERIGRENAVNAVCEQALRPERSEALGPLPAPPPAFSLPDWNGHDVSLAQAKGRVVLLNFWATWCPTCVVEMPSLEHLAQAERGRPFSLYAVSVDDSLDKVTRFFEGQSTQMTVLLDKDRAVPARYGTEKFPETFLVDKQGRARFFVVSDRNWSAPDVKACIDALIDE